MTDAILVINAGSSSLKFQLFGIEGDRLRRRLKGQMSGIGVAPHLQAADGNGAETVDRTYARDDVPDLPSAIAVCEDWLLGLEGVRIRAVGHRVVHGGPDHARPVLIDEKVLEQLATFQNLAPLHQPNNLAPIRRAMQIRPDVPQVACFDTAFHAGRPEAHACYALPRRFFEAGVRRYGFHGLSYEYIAERLHTVAPDHAMGRVVVAHLGSGASMCALKAGRSIETTMGFTALDGIPMGTRPGQLDPGVVLHLTEEMGMHPQDISDLLYHKSGLKGLSGVSSDMRKLLASDAAGSTLAIEHFVHRCALHAGLLAAACGGLDAFVFTAGIGENAPAIRAKLAKRLSWLGAELDADANERGATRISTADSHLALLVIPTDEELMIARHTLALLDGR